MEQIESELKALIVSSLFLEDVSPADIDSDEPLFGDGVQQHVDALEIGVEIQKKYGVKIDPEDEHLSDHFRTVRSLAKFVSGMR